MAQDYLNAQDIQLRLGNSICFLDDKPVYVTAYVRGEQETYPYVYCFTLGDLRGKPTKIDHRDERFSDRAPQLGYMHLNNTAYYLKRGPYRYQNQGLREENIIVCGVEGRMHDFLTSKSMEDCILGNHTTMDMALIELNINRERSISIHRHVAVSKIDNKNIGLHYRGRLVAIKGAEDWNWLAGEDKAVVRRLVEKTGCLEQ